MDHNTGMSHPEPTRHFFPRSHRLFAIFDDRATAEAALAKLDIEVGEAWYFEGEDGAIKLDPGTKVGLSRLLSWLSSNNIEVLRELGRLVAGGEVVVAIPARRLALAEQMARRVRSNDGEPFAYTTHGNFVPLAS